MSTKIYDAYRLPTNRLVEYIDWARGKMISVAKERIEEVMTYVKPEALKAPPEHIAGDKEGERLHERTQRLKTVMGWAKKAAESPYKDYFDIECGLNVWIHKGKAYVIPIGPANIVHSLNTPPDWVEEYGYWNNTDGPEHLTNRQWKARSKAWGQVCTGTGVASHNARRLWHEIISAKTFSSTWELCWDIANRDMQEWVKKRQEMEEST